MSPAATARDARAAKLKEVSAHIAKMGADSATSASAVAQPQQPNQPALLPSETHTGDAKPEPKIEAKPEEPAVEADEPAKVEAKPAEEVEAKPDPQTAKALAAIDKQAKKFRDEQVAAKRAFDQEIAEQRTELARMKQEMTSRYGSMEELQKLAEKSPIDLLRKLRPNMTEDDWEIVGRGAFPFTKTGKADPRAAEVAARVQKETTRDSELSELRKMVSDLTEQIATQGKKVEAQTFVENWQSEAIKAIPADKPTLIARVHAKSPAKARTALLAIGAELERANDGEAPSYGEVIAEFERRERAELEDRGVDVDALLAPSKPAPAPAAKSATLDVAAPAGGTRPINGRPTREQKLAAVTAGLRKLSADAQ
jgi:hypothetical protein